MNILDKIIETKRREVADAKRLDPALPERAKMSERKPLSFRAALEQSSTGIIAEFKRKSPSKGFFDAEARIEDVVPFYERGGAAAISVLTDKEYFGGSLDDLRRARGLVNIPLLRKDFIIDNYQIAEAKLNGADVILLIAAVLTPAQVKEFIDYAHELGLEVLLEIHNEEELRHIYDKVDVVGVNNRDLTTFVTDVKVSVMLSRLIPEGILKISESGISSPLTVKELRIYGYRGFLMGENFMKTGDPGKSLKEFTAQL